MKAATAEAFLTAAMTRLQVREREREREVGGDALVADAVGRSFVDVCLQRLSASSSDHFRASRGSDWSSSSATTETPTATDGSQAERGSCEDGAALSPPTLDMRRRGVWMLCMVMAAHVCGLNRWCLRQECSRIRSAGHSTARACGAAAL